MNKKQLLYIKSLYEMHNANNAKEMILFRNMFNLHSMFSTDERTELSSYLKNLYLNGVIITFNSN